MNDLSKYLLYTESDRDAFVMQHGEAIARNRPVYEAWINSLPMGVWRPVVRGGVGERETAFVVGLLCIIYCDPMRSCFFSFNQGATAIRRDPFGDPELMEWMYPEQ